MTSTNFQWNSCMSSASRTSTTSSIIQTLLQSFNSCRSLSPKTHLSNPVTILQMASSYLFTIAILSAYVSRKRPAFAQTPAFSKIAAMHNIILSLASLFMNMQVSLAMYSHSPSTETICIPRSTRLPSELSYPLYIFLLSKPYELIDTVILVLRGRPLTLLHVWHHTSVMFEVWAWLEYDFSLGLYGMWFNTFVHIFMYAYYAACLLGVKVKGKIIITMTQIIQFATSLLLIIPFAWLHYSTTEGCMGLPALYISAAINASYLVLFVLFFRSTYRKGGTRKSKSKSKKV